MSSSISSFFSAIFPVVYADSEERPTNGSGAKQETAEEPESEAAPAEEDEEPEDVSYELLMLFGPVNIFAAELPRSTLSSVKSASNLQNVPL